MSNCNTREQYLKTIKEILELISELHLPKSFAENFSELHDDIQSRELIVPVIGHFSAGKSAMLNSLMNSAVLPVGISPETSLATELRYAPTKKVTAYAADDGTPRSFSLAEFSTIVSRPSEWLYLTLELPYKSLQDLEPMILVDMPGFNSPVEQHSKAINLYLERGAFYIVLISADAGTVDRSIILQLELIRSMGRNFAVFISKSDLKTAAEIEKIKKHVEGVLRKEFDTAYRVVAISDKNVAEITQALRSVDPDELFRTIYQENLDEKINSLICSVRTEVSSLMNDTVNLTRAMREIQSSLQEFESKTEDEIRCMRNKYSGNMVNDIVNRIGSVLSMSADEIASLIISGDEKGAQQRINSLVQSEIIIQLQQKFGTISVNIASDLATSLKSLNVTMKELAIDSDFIKNICDSIQKILSCYDKGGTDSSKKGINAGAMLALGSTVSAAATSAATVTAGTTGTVLGFSLGTAIPVIGVVVAALPLILTPIFEKYQREHFREEIMNKLLTVIFPEIKHRLRAELSVQINTQIENMITRVKNEFQTVLKQKEDAVSEALKLKQQEKSVIDDRIAALEKAIQTLLKIMGNSGDIAS
jgi:GTP-binding protein EngB required for normal cell division